MHFAKNDPRWQWRFSYFASMVLPKLLAQTSQDFDICIRANAWHADELRALSPKIKVFDVKHTEKGKIKRGYAEKAKIYFVDFVDFKDTKGLEKYEVQIGIDSDDMILSPGFIDAVKMEIQKYPNKSLHISFQPFIFHAPTLRNFKCKFQYGPEKGSPIFAIYQPETNKRKKFIFAYEDSHLKLPRYFEKAVRITDGFCSYSVHDFNSSTRLYPNSRQTLL